jgi:hypothetical protein
VTVRVEFRKESLRGLGQRRIEPGARGGFQTT